MEVQLGKLASIIKALVVRQQVPRTRRIAVVRKPISLSIFNKSFSNWLKQISSNQGRINHIDQKMIGMEHHLSKETWIKILQK